MTRCLMPRNYVLPITVPRCDGDVLVESRLALDAHQATARGPVMANCLALAPASSTASQVPQHPSNVQNDIRICRHISCGTLSTSDFEHFDNHAQLMRTHEASRPGLPTASEQQFRAKNLPAQISLKALERKDIPFCHGRCWAKLCIIRRILNESRCHLLTTTSVRIADHGTLPSEITPGSVPSAA